MMTLAISVLLALAVQAQGSADYHPFIEEGKTWIYEVCNPQAYHANDNRNWTETYHLTGDTLINSHNCKKLHLSSDLQEGLVNYYCGALFEDGSRVYFILPESQTPQLLYDFSCKKGDTFVIHGHEMVMKEQLDIPYEGTSLNVLKWSQKENDMQKSLWVEGIGSTTNNLIDYFYDWEERNRYTLLSCSVNGTEIFANEEFQKAYAATQHYVYRPFVEEGKTWVERESVYVPYMGGLTTLKKSFTISGDTLIGQMPCKRLTCETIDRIQGTREYDVIGIYEENKRVYFIPQGGTDPLLLYDFDAPIGDTLTVYSLNRGNISSCKMVVMRRNEMGTVVGNLTYKEVLHHDYFWEWTWIEGVGSEDGPMENMTFGPEKGGWHWLENCCVGDEVLFHQGNVISYHPFIQEGKHWEYGFMYNYDELWLPAGEPFASESWLVTDRENIDGKAYWKLSRFSTFAHVKNMWRPAVGSENQSEVTGEVIAIREQDGKVYARKDQYLALLKALYPKEVHPDVNPDNFYVAEAEDPAEVLLYDFSLEEGDKYPCLGDVYVETVDRYITSDDRCHKMMRLSNGAILVEGIGCVNSIGGIVIYQNLENIREYFSHESGAGRMIYAQLLSCGFTGSDQVIYPGSEGYPEPAETYRPFIEEGKVWRTGIQPGNDYVQQFEYKFFEDSIIGGEVCKTMVRSELDKATCTPMDTIYVGAFYEKNHQVYYAAPGQETFQLLYDFGSAVGSEINLDGINASLTRRQPNLLDGFKGLWTEVLVSHENYTTFWMEGIGGLSNPMNSLPGLSTASSQNEVLLSCYYIATREVIYSLNNELDGPSEVKKKWLDFTHVVKPRPKSPQRVSASEKDASGEGAATSDEAAEQEMLTGEYSARELFVSLKTLTGAYTVTLTDAAGEVVYRKDVQTSNVVALNTLLTDYPDGKYTLTVENAEEQYTALLSLPLVDDAVRDLQDDKSVNRESVNGKWSDLSGRHLNSQPIRKGIYIKDGRKVLIK